MPSGPPTTRLAPLKRALLLAPFVLGGVVAAMGAVVLVAGWGLDLPSARSFDPALASMKPNTALGFFATGLALALAGRPGPPRSLLPARVLAALVLAATGATLAADVFEIPIFLDQLVFTDANPLGHPFPGRMSPGTAASFVATSVGLLLFGGPAAPRARATHGCAALVASSGLVAISGYAYSVGDLSGVSPFRSMALPTALGFSLLGLGLGVLRPWSRWTRLATHGGLHGRMMRRLLPAALAPLVVGWLVFWGERSGLYRPGFALVIAALGGTAILLLIVARTGSALADLEGERTRARAEVRQQREWLWTTLRSIGDGVIATDPQGVVTFANPMACTLMGQPVRLVEGRPIEASFVLIREASQEPAPSPVRAVIETGLPAYLEQHTQLQPASGPAIDIADACTPIRDDDGRMRGVVLVFYDVTKDRTAARELERAARHKDEFLAMLGHELRNPLAAIAHASTLLGYLGRDDRTRAPLEVLERQTSHLTRLVNDLLDASRVTHGRIVLSKERIDVKKVLETAVEDHRPRAEAKGLSLEHMGPGEPAWLEGDRARLYQMFDNLLENAIDFTEEGGRIFVECRRRGDRVRLSVRDTGAGLPATEIDAMFEPFRQGPQALHRPNSGLGLGLSLVKAIAELHGGRVEAYVPDVGTEMTVDLPLESKEAEASVPEAAEPRPAGVLVVEDELDLAQALTELLELDGHDVWVTGSGEEAIALYEAHRPAVVLCDLRLSGVLSGYDVAQTIRNSGHAPRRMVAVTAYGEIEHRRRAEAVGFDGLLPKPVPPEHILDIVRSAGREGGRAADAGYVSAVGSPS